MDTKQDKAKAILQAEIDLTRRVFGTQDGQELLDKLVERHVRSPIADFGSDSRTMWRLGQAELITNLTNIMEYGDE